MDEYIDGLRPRYIAQKFGAIIRDFKRQKEEIERASKKRKIARDYKHTDLRPEEGRRDRSFVEAFKRYDDELQRKYRQEGAPMLSDKHAGKPVVLENS